MKMKEIYIIKVKNFGSDIIDVICGYDNENSAIKHVESYKNIYKNDLKSDMWYDSLFIKSDFKIN
jgi:hypothetical protein